MRLPGLLNGPVAPLLIAILALVAAAAGLFSMPVLDRDEARFAQATAQMIESGDYVEISFLDEPRNKKPVGIHWLQAVAVQLTTGEEAREIWAYRLPSVLGAMLTALFCYFAGARLFSRRVGFAGAALIGVSVLLAVEGGIAKTDAMLSATAAGAFLALTTLRTAPSPLAARLASLLFWISLGLGALIKGPVTPMAGILAVITLIALERRISWAKPLAWWPGPVIAAVIVLPWLVAIQLATGGAFLMDAVGDDMGTKVVTGDEGHHGPPGYHLMLMAVLLGPATLTLPAGIRQVARHWRRHTQLANAARTLVAFILPTWIVFELLPTKLPHYTLPVYAALGVIAGLGLVRLDCTPALWRWLGAGLGAFGYAIAIIGILGFAMIYGDLPFGPAAIGGAALGVLAFATLLATGLGKPATVLVLAVVTGLSWHVGVRGVLAPQAETFFVSRDTAAATLALQTRHPGADVVSTFTEPSFVFGVGGMVTLIDPAELSRTEINPAQPRLYVIDESRWLQVEGGTLDDEAETQRLNWLIAVQEAACDADAAQGINYSRGDDVVNVFIFATGCGTPTSSPDPTPQEPEDQP